MPIYFKNILNRVCEKHLLLETLAYRHNQLSSCLQHSTISTHLATKLLDPCLFRAYKKGIHFKLLEVYQITSSMF
jgi:hypothetical protein